MFDLGVVTVTDADNLNWKAQVLWRPRFLGLVQKIGGWRDKRRHPDQGFDIIDAFDPGTGPYYGWDYDITSVADSAVDAANGPSGGSGGGWFDNFDIDGDGDFFAVILAVIVALLAVIVAVVVFWWVLLPALLIVLDGLAVIGLLVVGTIARIAFRRPWTVQAESAKGHRLTKKVVGWRNAQRERDNLVSALRNGSIRGNSAA